MYIYIYIYMIERPLGTILFRLLLINFRASRRIERINPFNSFNPPEPFGGLKGLKGLKTLMAGPPTGVLEALED